MHVGRQVVAHYEVAHERVDGAKDLAEPQLVSKVRRCKDVVKACWLAAAASEQRRCRQCSSCSIHAISVGSVAALMTHPQAGVRPDGHVAWVNNGNEDGGGEAVAKRLLESALRNALCL